MEFVFNSISDMPPFKEQGCCDSGCNCKTSNIKSTLPCPKCRKFGEAVSNLTVHSLAKKEHKANIDRNGDDAFNLCTTPECDIAYYNARCSLTTGQLKTPIHFKNGASKHLVCYCLKISKEEIIDAVHNKKLTGMRDIMEALKSAPPCVCEKNNPTGLCCEDAFNAVIKEAIADYGNRSL